MPEHYPAETLARTRALYGEILRWTADRNDATIIGGWAVHHHVEPARAMQSRDVDVVLHSEHALKEILDQLQQWHLRLRRKGRKTFPDAHFQDEDPLAFRLDLFTTTPTPAWIRLFGRQGAENVKQAPQQIYPDLEWILQDKLSTVALRRDPDGKDKRAKDLIDAYNLIFHNRERRPSRELLRSVPPATRQRARGFLDEAVATRPEYSDALAILAQWLEA